MNRVPLHLSLLALILAAGTLPLAAQSDGAGLLTGVVQGADGEPIEGATVRLWPARSPADAVEIATDAKGRWTRVELVPGPWEIRILASGHVEGQGWVEVPATGVAAPVEVELRSLDEETAAFIEGSSGSVMRWIERANNLLAQGRASEAREEYRKALAELQLAERPAALRAVARTWYLDGELQNAIDTLIEALRIAPHDAESRLLFRGLLDEIGQGADVDRRLAEIEAAGPPPEVVETEDRPRVTPLDLPPVETPLAHRTGRQSVFFTEMSPLGSAEVYAQRFDVGDDLAEVPPEVLARSLDGETFQVYVPETYRPEEPHGLLVWVSPTPFGGFRSAEFPEVLARRKLIWVGADGAGNERGRWERSALALDAAHNMTRLYTIDPQRVYVAGYSGGGRLSSSLVLLYPELFTGGIFYYGCNWFERIGVPDKPGSFWPASFPPPRDLEALRRHSRLVFVTGQLDFNRQQTRAIRRRAEANGFEHVTYIEIPGANHYYGIPGEWLDRSLDALSGAE
jgi:tetratricopeptide (TPR) repeat protein